jgi:hypothetical protein
MFEKIADWMLPKECGKEMQTKRLKRESCKEMSCLWLLVLFNDEKIRLHRWHSSAL